jgi:hypothetical protein
VAAREVLTLATCLAVNTVWSRRVLLSCAIMSPRRAAHSKRQPDLDMSSKRSKRKQRMGALPPRYAFVLNPHAEAGFTKCPRCEAKTHVRKLSLVIHVEDFGLVLLGKTCRLCLGCETLVAHQADLDKLIGIAVAGSDSPKYVVLGTVDRRVWRRGLEGRVALQEVVQQMADFKTYLRVDLTPAGWYPKSEVR